MGGMLVLHGGDAFARAVLGREGRALWSRALPAVLEKHGLLGASFRGPEALAERDLWQRHDCVLVTRMAPGALPPDAVRALVASGTPALLEAPLDGAVADALGLAGVAPAAPEITVTVDDPQLIAAAKAYGYGPGGQLRRSVAKPMPRSEDLDWQALPVPLDERHAAAWRAPGWDVQTVVPGAGVEVLAHWTADGGADGPQPAVVRRGALTACTFGLLSALAQSHTSEPAERGHWPSSPRVTGLETLLLALVDDLHRRAGRPRTRVLPWPEGARWALSVRHDVDRPLSPARADELLARHRRAGTRATWYWRARHLQRGRSPALLRLRPGTEGNRAVRVVAEAAGHEVALHTELMWADRDGERRTVESVIGRRLRGASAHGDPNCFRYQGAPNVMWAEREGMLYTELIQHAHFHPHRFAQLAASGEVRLLDVLCLPHHESFDRTMQPGGTHAERILEVCARWQAVGGLMQVMNHPDLHTDELFATLGRLPREGRIDLTAAQAADWWRRTHTTGALRLETTDDGCVRATARDAVRGLQVEQLSPDGRRVVRATDLEPGRPAEVATSR